MNDDAQFIHESDQIHAHVDDAVRGFMDHCGAERTKNVISDLQQGRLAVALGALGTKGVAMLTIVALNESILRIGDAMRAER